MKPHFIPTPTAKRLKTNNSKYNDETVGLENIVGQQNTQKLWQTEWQFLTELPSGRAIAFRGRYPNKHTDIDQQKDV